MFMSRNTPFLTKKNNFLNRLTFLLTGKCWIHFGTLCVTLQRSLWILNSLYSSHLKTLLNTSQLRVTSLSCFVTVTHTRIIIFLYFLQASQSLVCIIRVIMATSLLHTPLPITCPRHYTFFVIHVFSH